MPKPFVVDPAVLASIRPMQFRDAAVVAAMHKAAMGNSLWAKLGEGFLTELYQGLVEDPRFLGFVYTEDEQIQGFIAGSMDASAMMSEVFQKRWFLLGPRAAVGLLRRPSVLKHLIHTARYFAVSGDEELEVPAESLFCSFTPACRGKRISGHINKVLFDDLLARGHRYVKITTETDNEGANRQLTSWGFQDRGRFHFYGKEMVLYVLDLQASERVEPRLWHPTLG
jgi:ribosomal protein S18 acetylase RimI-like enzyme